MIEAMRQAVEEKLQQVVGEMKQPGYELLHHMMAYVMGWEGEGAGPEARGKRIRPVLVLLTAAAAGGRWEAALPAAAAVELVHNFSLIHDDIEDKSDLRRGRPTVWKQWGVPQAVNTGDTMFTLAHLTVLGLEQTVSAAAALRAALILQQTCLKLTQGQFLDISYENRIDLSEADYWPMVEGKTGALISACARLGAIAAEAPVARAESFAHFGRCLGLAFQAQDDVLGIWGDPTVTGKSAASDLVSGKKSLPVLIGLERNGAFAQRWRQGRITEAEAPLLADMLAQEGVREVVKAASERLTDEALQALEQAHPYAAAGQALQELALKLLKRNM